MEKAIDFCFRTAGVAGSVTPTRQKSECVFVRTKNMFFIFLLAQRHLHPADVENRPNGLTINIFIGRQVGTGIHKSD